MEICILPHQSLTLPETGLLPGQVQVYKDTVVPFGAITAPSFGYFQNSISVYGFAEVGAIVSLTISDSDADTRNIVITPISVTLSGDWTAANIDISSLVDGSLTLSATITDVAGNVANSNIVSTVMKDTVAAISITSPISGSYVNFMTASGLGVSGRGDALGFVTVVATDSRRNTITSTTTVAGESAHKYEFGKFCGRNRELGSKYC